MPQPPPQMTDPSSHGIQVTVDLSQDKEVNQNNILNSSANQSEGEVDNRKPAAVQTPRTTTSKKNLTQAENQPAEKSTYSPTAANKNPESNNSQAVQTPKTKKSKKNLAQHMNQAENQPAEKSTNSPKAAKKASANNSSQAVEEKEKHLKDSQKAAKKKSTQNTSQAAKAPASKLKDPPKAAEQKRQTRSSAMKPQQIQIEPEKNSIDINDFIPLKGFMHLLDGQFYKEYNQSQVNLKKAIEVKKEGRDQLLKLVQSGNAEVVSQALTLLFSFFSTTTSKPGKTDKDQDPMEYVGRGAILENQSEIPHLLIEMLVAYFVKKETGVTTLTGDDIRDHLLTEGMFESMPFFDQLPRIPKKVNLASSEQISAKAYGNQDPKEGTDKKGITIRDLFGTAEKPDSEDSSSTESSDDSSTEMETSNRDEDDGEEEKGSKSNEKRQRF